MTNYRHAGVGFPNGPVDLDAILALPSPGLLILASEHWHVNRAQQAGKQVLFRTMARNGYRPAEAKYSPVLHLNEITRHTGSDFVETMQGFIPWNELDLNYERGDGEDDYQNLNDRYSLLGIFQYGVVRLLRKVWRSGIELHYGAWTPDHHALDHIGSWRPAAEACDVIDFHAYRTLDEIRGQYEAYRDAFPEKKLALTEWHCHGNLEEEQRVLTWLAEAMHADPLFAGAYFFIWRWDNPADWWKTAYDIEHDHHRRALFMDPPVYEEQLVGPDLEQLAHDAAVSAGIDPDTFVKQIRQESGFDPTAYNAASGASGIAQIVPRWHPKKNGWDPATDVWIPELALGYAARLMADHLRYYRGDQAKALSAYNAGRDATDQGLSGGLDGWPYLETVRYVSNILDIPQHDARQRLTLGQAPVAEVLYGTDVPDDVVRQRNDWTCAVRATYAALWAMHQGGHGPKVTYGDEEPTDVYDWLVPRYDDSTAGLKDGSGAGLAALLREKGYESFVDTDASLADVQALAGTRPVLIGGRNWGPAGHWAYVRGKEADGTLILENPAGTYGGIADRLRDSFTKLGPWSAVWIDPLTESVPVPPRHEEEDVARIAELELQISSLLSSNAKLILERDAAIATRNSLIEGFAYAADDLGDVIQGGLDAIRSIRTQRIGARP